MAGSGSVIVLENLKDIRSTTKQRGKRQRRRHHGWSYEQLKYFIEYTAEAAGCRVETVDPRKTSQRCSKCGHTARPNRKNQSLFVCGACSFSLNADLNVARSIAWKYLAQDGMPVLGGPSVNRPIVRRLKPTPARGIAAEWSYKPRLSRRGRSRNIPDSANNGVKSAFFHVDRVYFFKRVGEGGFSLSVFSNITRV
jgi:IS605 OrfB family transposase